MAPVPYESGDQPTDELPELVCPRCGGTLRRYRQATACLDCNYVPRHGAD